MLRSVSNLQIIKALLLMVLLTGSLACERNNMTYGGIKEYNENPPYDVKVDLNRPSGQK